MEDVDNESDIEEFHEDIDDELEEDEQGEDDDVLRAPIDDDADEFSVLEKDDDAHTRVLREELRFFMHDANESPPFATKKDFDFQTRGYVTHLGCFKHNEGEFIIHKLYHKCLQLTVKYTNIGISRTRSSVKPLTYGRLKVYYALRMYESIYKRPTQRSLCCDDEVLGPPSTFQI